MKLTTIAAAFFLLTVIAWARPQTIKCPIDGNDMYFSHQVGYGKDAVCWYFHVVAGGKHEGYVPCNDK